jgi:hypothetical protein
MAHLPIRKKPAPTAPLNLLPMALILAAGVLVTVLVDGARKPATQMARELEQEVLPLAVERLKPLVDARTLAIEAKASRMAFDVAGRAWILAAHPPITDFKPEEIQFQEEIDGWTLVANKVRGVPALNANAHAYDRLYLQTAPNRYAALRWRDTQ